MRIVAAAVLLGFLSAAAAGGADRKQGEGLRRTVLTVKGMMCRSCAGAVEQALRRVPGVAKVAVDTGSGTVEVAYGGSVTPEGLREAVRKGGSRTEIRAPEPRQR